MVKVGQCDHSYYYKGPSVFYTGLLEPGIINNLLLFTTVWSKMFLFKIDILKSLKILQSKAAFTNPLFLTKPTPPECYYGETDDEFVLILIIGIILGILLLGFFLLLCFKVCCYDYVSHTRTTYARTPHTQSEAVRGREFHFILRDRQ